MGLKKANDEVLWHEWGELITAAAQIKRELTGGKISQP